jgi:hypothetical protein
MEEFSQGPEFRTAVWSAQLFKITTWYWYKNLRLVLNFELRDLEIKDAIVFLSLLQGVTRHVIFFRHSLKIWVEMGG